MGSVTAILPRAMAVVQRNLVENCNGHLVENCNVFFRVAATLSPHSRHGVAMGVPWGRAPVAIGATISRDRAKVAEYEGHRPQLFLRLDTKPCHTIM
jgi:hypothetical protein